MLYWLTQLLAQHFQNFEIFHYLSLRAILAAITSLIISLSLGPGFIKRLQSMQMGQVVRDDGPQSHLSKRGTPTMGGALIVFSIVVGTVLWVDLTNRFIWMLCIVTVSYALIGWLDDYQKIVLKSSKGLSARKKLALQSVVALVVSLYLFHISMFPVQTELLIPFIKNYSIPLGGFFVVLSFFVIVGTSNAVNLTDGLDGLAILPCVLVASALGVFAYFTGNHVFADYLSIPFIPGVGECVIFCGAFIGAGLGFLWFNAYPAEIFMGDVGSLGLGAAIGLLAVIVRQEIVLVIMGGIFVVETLSVIIQVLSFKIRGKRVFRMAPIHHHYELKGWPEPKVIVRFWIITFVLVLLGLASLKIR